MSDMGSLRGSWRSWVAVSVVVALALTSLVIYLIRFDTIDHVSIYFAQGAVAAGILFGLLGWLPAGRKSRDKQ